MAQRVHTELSEAMDVGIRVNPELAKALGVETREHQNDAEAAGGAEPTGAFVTAPTAAAAAEARTTVEHFPDAERGTVPEISCELEGRRISYNFLGMGWCQGEVLAWAEDGRFVTKEIVVEKCDFDTNLIVYYPCDETEVEHTLTMDMYSSRVDAPTHSWYLVTEELDTVT